jgi:galactokinase
MDLSRLALLCQKAEHDFAGAPVGIMDMTAVAFGPRESRDAARLPRPL